MAASTLTIFGTAPTWATTRYEMLTETSAIEQQIYRAPFGTSWFAVGDGGWAPLPFRVKIVLRDSSAAALAADRTAFLAAIEGATSVTEGTRNRAVQGIREYTETPVLLGYSYVVTFLPTGHGWS